LFESESESRKQQLAGLAEVTRLGGGRRPVAHLALGWWGHEIRPASLLRLGAPSRLCCSRLVLAAEVGGRFHQVRTSGRPAVIMSWHEALLPVLAAPGAEFRGDECWARRSASGCVRPPNRPSDHPGSSSRGGARALLRAVRALREGRVVGFTPDGPRGPRRVIKPGVLLAAQRGGGVVVPVHAEAHPAWRLASWDTMLIPKPFAKVRIAYGAPFSWSPVRGVAPSLRRGPRKAWRKSPD
jgi:hypothetical protein